MALNWKRSKKVSGLTLTGNQSDVFLTVNNLGGETHDVFVINDGNNHQFVANGTVFNDIDFDYGMMSLPKGTQICDFDPNTLTISIRNPALPDDFFGKVLFDLQTDFLKNSELFRGATNFNLCRSQGILINVQGITKHGYCAAASLSKISINNNEIITFPEITLLYIPNKVDLDGPGEPFYAIPFLLPEKLVAFYIMKDSTNNPIEKQVKKIYDAIDVFKSLYDPKYLNDHYMFFEFTNGLSRHDDIGFHYSTRIDFYRIFNDPNKGFLSQQIIVPEPV